MKAAVFDYHAPATIEEALALIAAHGDEARIIAGGQSLVPVMTARLARPAHLVDVNRIPRLERPTILAGRLRIPPLMRHVDFESAGLHGPLGPLLARIAAQIGHRPIRLRGTFCGALAHADPAAEWCLAAVVLSADLVARSAARGARTIPAEDFFTGVMTTALADDEMLVEVQIPLLPATARTGFSAVRRQQGTFALALCLAVIERDGEIMRNVHLGVGGVEGVPRRIREAEALLEGRAPSRDLFREAADAAFESVDPLGDAQGDAAWRRELARAVVHRALEETL